MSALAGLTQLTYLDLWRNPKLTEAGIDKLQKALPKCIIWHDYLTSAEEIEVGIRKQLKKPAGELTKADLEKVSSLTLRNKITDLKPLKALTRLEKLTINRNYSKDLTPLMGLKSLRYFVLKGAPYYKETDVHNLIKALPNSKDKPGVFSSIEYYLNPEDSATLIYLCSSTVPRDLFDLSRGVRLRSTEKEKSSFNLYSAYRVNALKRVRARPIITDYSKLSELTHLKRVSIANHGPFSLVHVQNLKELETLTVKAPHWPGAPSVYAHKVMDHEKARAARPLNPITDLTPLKELTKLRRLDLEFTINISDLTPLSKLHNLQGILLGHNQIIDLSPLMGLRKLNYLTLNNNKITDLSPLMGLRKLNYLILNNNKISDISPLSGLKGVDTLDLSENNISDLKPLEPIIKNSPKISQLSLNGNNITSLKGLEGLRKIDFLFLEDNQISDLTPLDGLTVQDDLNLSNNRISDLRPLKGIEADGFELSGNLISDLSPLSETAIRYLSVSNNKISDLSPLAKIKSLTQLRISNNPDLTKAEIAELQKALPKCKITHNAKK